MSPNPFATDASVFEQHLFINDGYVTFTGDNSTLLQLWVDMFTAAIHVEVTSSIEVNLTASFETWRTVGRNMSSGEQREMAQLMIIIFTENVN